MGRRVRGLERRPWHLGRRPLRLRRWRARRECARDARRGRSRAAARPKDRALGNWWNQELFGKPTRLPWALEFSPAHRLPGYGQYATFHPTFLYESLWDLLCVGLLLWIDRRFALRRPALFALYVSFYTAFRSYKETLRIDLGSHYYLGFRLNFFVSLAVFVAATAFFVWWQFIQPANELPTAELAEHA